VSPEHQNEVVPCHHIPLDQAGNTIEDLEAEDNESKAQRLLKEWLRARIKELEGTAH